MPAEADDQHDVRGKAVTERSRSTRFGPVEWVAETGSTNDDLMRAAGAGAEPGLVRIADHQTAGRGRRDRRWETAPGDALLLSVLLDYADAPTAASTATTVVALSATEALEALGFDMIRLKWPNDLVVGEPGVQLKLAGVLAHGVVVGERFRVVVGIGLNLRGERLDAEQAVALDQLAGAPAVPDTADLVVGLLQRADAWLDRLAGPTGVADLRAAAIASSATVGTMVRADLGDRVISGRAATITDEGALVIQPAAPGAPAVEITTADVVSLRPGPT